jgi:hypothetical protein
LNWDRETKRAERKANKQAAAVAARDSAVFQGIMAHAGSRAWMYDLLFQCHLFASSFTGEALSSAFKEGERNIGLILLNGIMQACPEAYVQMMGEQNAGSERPRDKSDPDEPRNWDDAGSWIGDGDEPE